MTDTNTDTILVFTIADNHTNRTTGLLYPTTRLDDGQEVRYSRPQRWLWECFTDCCTYAKEVARKNKAEIWLVLDGDIADGDAKNRTYQTITRNPATILEITQKTLQPALDISKRVFVVRGTAAHVGNSAFHEELLANDIGAEVCPATGASTWWQLDLLAGGVLFHFQHHGTLGHDPWTVPNALNKRASKIMLAYGKRRCPDVALQAHMHQYATSGDNYPVEVIALPSWELNKYGDYPNRLGLVEIADIGSILFLCKNGHYEKIKRLYTPERDAPWRPK